MYPVLVRLGPFDVTRFGLLVGVGALAGRHIFARELHRRDLPAGAVNGAIGGLMFGLAGAKLPWVLEHLREEPLLSLLLTRGGMSWFGGFAEVESVPGCCFCDSLESHSFQRWRPPRRRWRWDRQSGVSGAALLVGIWYLLTRWGRAQVDDRRIVAGYLTMVGTVRLAIEFIRVDTRVLGRFTIAHFASMAPVGTGVALVHDEGLAESSAPLQESATRTRSLTTMGVLDAAQGRKASGGTAAPDRIRERRIAPTTAYSMPTRRMSPRFGDSPDRSQELARVRVTGIDIERVLYRTRGFT